MVFKTGLITVETAWKPSLASWSLAVKSKVGERATFSHWPKLDTLFATQAWILLCHLPLAKAIKKEVLSVRYLRSVFHRLKGCFCELIKNNGEVPLW